MLAGRPKKYNKADVLQKCMELFWDKGFFPVSIRQIEAATRTRSQSLYNQFGDKEGIFISSMEHYFNSVFIKLIQQVEQEPDPVAAIKLVLTHFKDCALRPHLPGCFLANAIVEMGNDERVKDIYDKGVEQLEEALRQRLIEIPNRYNEETAKVTAAMMMNSLIGLAVASRSQPTEEAIDLIHKGLLRMIEG